MNTGMQERASAAPVQSSHRSASTDRPRIAVILPRGESIRNFVYNGALDEVAATAELAVLSVVPSPEIRRLLEDRYPRLLELKAVPESSVVGSLREGLDMAHGRWLWSKAAQERWRLRDYDACTPWLRTKRWSKKFACLPFANRPGLELLSKLERTASRWLRTTEEYLHFFQEFKPTLVFNSSHVHSQIAIQAVQAAQWLGIPTATFIFSWDNLTSQGRIMPPYDHYLVWNEAIREQLLHIYGTVRREQVFVTGTPQFDSHFDPRIEWSREAFCERVGADPARPIVLYSTGMENHMPGEPLVIEGIAAMLREMVEFGRPQLLVRIYPKDRQPARFDEVKLRCPDVLFPDIPWVKSYWTPKIEDFHLLPNMLRHAALGINVASTVSLELCMMDKPVINVGYNPPGIDIRPIEYRRYYDFDHYRPVVDSGAVKLAQSEAEMGQMLRKAFAEPQAESAQRRALIQSMFGDTLDGKRGARIASLLVELAAKQ